MNFNFWIFDLNGQGSNGQFLILFFSLLGWRFGLQAVALALSSLFFVGLFYRSASLYHPQRRAILHLKDMSKRKGKDKSKIESKPPYFDFSLMYARSFQVLLFCTAFSCLGAYTPLFFFVSTVRIQTKGLQIKKPLKKGLWAVPYSNYRNNRSFHPYFAHCTILTIVLVIKWI